MEEKLDLISFEGFHDYWFSQLKGKTTHEEAYELAEIKYKELYPHAKKRRYKNFESFRASKYDYFKLHGRL